MASIRKAKTARENGAKGGRPKGTYARHTLEAITARAYFVRMVEENMPTIFAALVAKAEAGDVMAIRELLDRSWGKPKQEIESTTTIKGELAISDKVKELARRLQAK